MSTAGAEAHFGCGRVPEPVQAVQMEGMWSRQVDHGQSSIYLIGAINTRKSGVIEGAKHARCTLVNNNDGTC